MKKITIIPLLLLAVLVAWGQTSSRLRINSILQSNMVIQQNKPFKVWGWAPAGERVAVQADWLPVPVQGMADPEGRFCLIMQVPAVKDGDFTKHTLAVTSAGESVGLTNVLIGEVWICSGQSNMQFSMKETIDSAIEVPAADYPGIRLFNGGLNFSNEPVDSIRGSWQACTPATVRNFPAVAYHFGRELHKALDLPVGIIFTGIGASAAQAYVPKEVLAADPKLDSVYLQPYLRSPKAQEKIGPGFSFEKVTRPFLLYNALIHPFTPLSVRGFTWYQGEANRAERESYTRLTQALIKSWRKNFGQGNLPFYYVQIAPYWYEQADSTLADCAFFREAQEKISTLGNTEMVLTMDVGEAKNLHPKNKKPIGVRLARTALNREYGLLDISYKGPQYDFTAFDKNKATIHFRPETIKSGLSTNDGRAPAFFTIAGNDQVFYPATAIIQENTIVISSGKVKKPVAVRYAFTNFPVTNLQNKDGFPAVPFRTDNWNEANSGNKK
ncbi:MAG: sialate O-acetylesterase [Williamsia sp.]|nr:sialate O-acetylesterase [Williamsia sp.]